MKFILLSLLGLATTCGCENEIDQQHCAVPACQEPNRTKIILNQAGAVISHTENIFDNDKHRLDATASLGKNWDSQDLKPDQIGGRLDYNHKPSGSSVFVGADKVRGYGTDVNAGVKYNIYQEKNLEVDVTAQYQRKFGGPGGTGKPNAGILLSVHGRF